jgi:N6-L-threonylcarbamoyladenine synthase
MMPVVEKAMKDANCTWNDIDAIAVTHAPGLLGSLLIGTLTARSLAIVHDKPLYAVHHLKSHIYANWLSDQTPEFPLLALVISGGHTQILYMPSHDKFEIIGTTRDDAIGECFDKVAKILGLPYPGGPSIAKAAKEGDENKYKFPHPKIDGLDFSFSGLKTAVLRAVQKELNLPISHPSHDLKNHLTKKQVNDFAASFQKTAVDILLEKLSAAKQQHPDVKSIVFAGGVSANEALREKAEGYFPQKSLSGDNGAMVAAAAYYEIQAGKKPTDPYKMNIYPRISINA